MTPGSEDHAAFEFALYAELEALGDYGAAWRALERANSVMKLRAPVVEEPDLFERIRHRCDAAFVSGQHNAEPSASGPTPIFVLGMPRSGTTVLDRILGNHPAVCSAGELPDFGHQLRWAVDRPGRRLVDADLLDRLPAVDWRALGERYLLQTQWRADGRSHYVDKLPANFMVLGLIAKALPQAKFVHSTRNPMALCFSNYRALFGDAYAYSYDLQTLATHWQQYRQLMAHWHQVLPGRIFDIDHDALVQAPDATAADLLAFCGLPAVDNCADISRNNAPVATLSAPQVRGGISARGAEQWRRYERQLAPLAAALGI